MEGRGSMVKTLLLLAGYPATGKSTFCLQFLRQHPDVLVVAPDDIKEEVWDEMGFEDADDKAAKELIVWKRYYERLEGLMSQGVPIVTDYPFSDKQKPALVSLVEKHGYRPITIRFVGDLDEIYKRSLARDLSQSRHLGHLMSHYHKGDYLGDRRKADALVTPELLRDRCICKGYGSFQMGDLVEVDATDIGSVDHDAIIRQVDSLIVESCDA